MLQHLALPTATRRMLPHPASYNFPLAPPYHLEVYSDYNMKVTSITCLAPP